MFFLLVCSLGTDPAVVVENRCPAFVVTNKCPAPAVAKPVKYVNGLNCTASFCGANGGPGCGAMGRTCPNSAGGACCCGNAATAVTAAPVTFSIPQSQSSCPSGGCPQSAPQRRGLFGWR